MQFMPWAEYWYNTTYLAAAKCTSFKVMYQRAPPSLARYISGETAVEVVTQNLINRDEASKQIKFHLQHAQDQISKFDNRFRRPSEIKWGMKFI